jgi:hypothetical protein
VKALDLRLIDDPLILTTFLFSLPIDRLDATKEYLPALSGSSAFLTGSHRTHIQVSASKDDEFPAKGFQFLFRGTGFQHSPADSGHRSLEHRRYNSRICRELFRSGFQHLGYGIAGANTGLRTIFAASTSPLTE